MYIQPNSTIKFYSLLPLDKAYNNTLYFDSLQAQTAFFTGSLARYTLSNNSYQRVNKRSMKVALKAEQLYTCNYLAFQNTSYGNKWFYAFIDNVEYINNETTLVTYTLDSLQTYMFDISFQQCLVEREHVADDTIGKHTINEGIDFGPLKTKDINTIFFKHFVLVLASTMDLTNATSDFTTAVVGDIYGNVYSGTKLYGFDLLDEDDVEAVNNVLTRAGQIGKSSIIVGMYMIPAEFITVGTNHEVIANNPVSLAYNFNKPTNLDGYTPKNNKLFCYPYCSVEASNLAGNLNSYHPELFYENKLSFEVACSIVQTARMRLQPYHYNGPELAYDLNGSVLSEPFPQCSWNINTYANYTARLLVETKANVDYGWTASAFSSGLSMLANYGMAFQPGGTSRFDSGIMASGVNQSYAEYNTYQSAINTATAPANNWANAMQNYAISSASAQTMGNAVAGQVGGGGTNVSLGQFGFYIETKTIRSEYAKMLDEYFSMYGYKVNTVKVPTFNVRPRWNYIKTSGCTITGKCPASDIVTIQNIFDSGITFWKNSTEVGQYDLPNNI